MSPIFIAFVLALFKSTFAGRTINAFVRRDHAAMKTLVQDSSNVEDCRLVLFHELNGASTEGLQFLVNAKINVDLTDYKGLTALHHAVSRNRADIVKILLQGKPDFSQYHDDGSFTLDWAIRKKHFDLVELLEQAGAVVHHNDDAETIHS